MLAIMESQPGQEGAPSGAMNDLFLATVKSVYDAKDVDSRTKASALDRLRSEFVVCIHLYFNLSVRLRSAWEWFLCFQM